MANLFSVEHSTIMKPTLERDLEKYGWMKWSVLVQKADWKTAHIITGVNMTVVMEKMLV